MRFLEPDAVANLFQMAKENRPRPKVITDQVERIAAATRAAEFQALNKGVVSRSVVQEIVEMKLDLDYLYGLWAEGKIENKFEIVIARR